MEELVLASRDKTKFKISLRAAEVSQTLKNLIPIMDDLSEEIPVDVDSAILEKVVLYCEKYLKSKDSGQEISNQWNLKFLNVDQTTLFEILAAADYLEIEPLVELCSSMIANIIKGCNSVEQIRSVFGIENDMSKEEEERIKKENAWALN